MITIENREYRNLQEQVLKNKQDIEKIIEDDIVLGRMGIKVVGMVNTEAELPDPSTYVGEYGNAYLVGTERPYEFYIFTRPFLGEQYPTWFNLGHFPVAGPQGTAGPTGPQGPQGVRGNTIHFGYSIPTNTISDLIEGDFYLNGQSKLLYRYTGGVWQAIAELKGGQGDPGIQGPEGPTGPVGPQGERGPIGEPGSAIRIVDVMPSVDALPTPSEDIRSDGYLVMIDGAYHIYGITGTTTLTWKDFGPLGAGGGTSVYAGGQLQASWDADTKLDKYTGSGSYIYGTNGIIHYEESPYEYGQMGDVVTRTYNGAILVPDNEEGEGGYAAVNYNTVRQMLQNSGGEAFPVGSVYMTTSSNTPDYDLGYGTWERIADESLFMATDIAEGQRGGTYENIGIAGSGGFRRAYLVYAYVRIS